MRATARSTGQLFLSLLQTKRQPSDVTLARSALVLWDAKILTSLIKVQIEFLLSSLLRPCPFHKLVNLKEVDFYSAKLCRQPAEASQMATG